jgi:hypothetical protein
MLQRYDIDAQVLAGFASLYFGNYLPGLTDCLPQVFVGLRAGFPQENASRAAILARTMKAQVGPSGGLMPTVLVTKLCLCNFS